MLRRFLLFSALVFLAAIPARATNAVWLAPSSAGGNTGADCSNPKAAVAYFNSSGNWSGSPSGILIGPDTTVHLCAGTYTGSAGADSFLQFQGSGTSGHPIILKWETGAIVQAPYFSANHGGIDGNGQNFITIDGGTNGILQNTANGTGLTYQQDTALIKGMGTNWTITNLSMPNIYQHTIGDNAGGGAQGWAFGVWGSSSFLTVGPGNTFTQCNVCVFYAFQGGETNLVITGNNFSLSNQAIEMGPGSTGVKVMTNVQIDHNTYVASRNWDNTLNYYHHNFFHPFTNTAGSSYTGTLQVFDNTSSGDVGLHSTSMIFIENNNGGSGGSMGPWYIFNNTFNKTNTDAPGSSGIVAVMSPNGFFLNNTVVDAGGTGGNIWPAFNAYGGATGWTVENNIFSSPGYLIDIQSPATVTADDNVYYGGGQFVFGSTFTSSISTWRTACACDANSTTANPQLTSTLGIGSGSSAINLGANLVSLSITPLDFDVLGVARPGSGAWTSGAATTGGSVAALTLSPTSPLAFGSQNTGTTSGASTVTVTSSGSGMTVLSPSTPPYTITGSNPGDFSVSGSPTCTPSLSMATTTTCTIPVKFTPSAAGARSARLNILSNAAGSNYEDLTGTGATPGGVNLIDASRELKNIVQVANGGLGLIAVSADQVPLGTGTNTYTAKSIPNCLDTGGQHINYNTSTHVWSCGTSGVGGAGGGTSSPSPVTRTWSYMGTTGGANGLSTAGSGSDRVATTSQCNAQSGTFSGPPVFSSSYTICAYSITGNPVGAGGAAGAWGTGSNLLFQSVVGLNPITSIRFRAGMDGGGSSLTTWTNSTTIPINSAAIRYDTSVPDSHFICESSDGSSVTTVDSGVTPITNTLYTLQIQFNDSVPNIKYYIDSGTHISSPTLVCTITTHLPSASTPLRVYDAVGLLASVTTNLYISWIYVEADH